MTRLAVWVSHAQDGDIGGYDFDCDIGRFVGSARHPAEPVVMPMALSWARRVTLASPHAARVSARPDGALLLAATRAENRHIVIYRVVDTASSSISGNASISPAVFEKTWPRLQRLGRASIASSLAYVEIDPSGRTAIGASYGENRVSVYDVDTLLSAAGGHSAQEGDGKKRDTDIDMLREVPPRQVIDGVAHAHAVVVSRDGRHVYVSALGGNAVWCFTLQDGQLTVNDVVDVGAGFGPRHMRLSLAEDYLHVLSEFQGVVATYARAPETGHLTLISISPRSDGLSALIQGRARPNFSDPDQPDPTEMARWIWAADLQLTPDNRFLYISERASSRIIVHAADETHGWQPVSWIDTEAQPRGIAIDANGQYLFASGERSDFLSAYRIDSATGALTLSDRCASGKGANWITVAAPLAG
ncbi:6-phosphogluconolactonase [Robbsia andropogonis]|uniref:lactonase family protein n=1 Tax=Robbsia andropogonis TaxID=28092 RepID=UPI003D1D31A5